MARKIKRGCLIPLILFLICMVVAIVLNLYARSAAPGWPMRVEGVRLEPSLPLLHEDDLDESYVYYHLVNLPPIYDIPYDKGDRDALAQGDIDACTNMLAWFELNPDWLEPLRACAEAANKQVPTHTNVNAMVLMSTMDIHTRLALSTALKAREGDWKAVTEALQLQWAISQSVSTGGTLIHHLLGVAGDGITLASINRLCESYAIPPDQARKWQEHIRVHQARRQDLGESMRHERLFGQACIDLVYTQGLGAIGATPGPWINPWLTLLGSTPQKTKGHFDDFYSYLIHEAGMPVYTNNAEQIIDTFFEAPPQLIWFRPDPLGRILASMLLPGMQSGRTGEAHAVVRAECTTLHLAVERWQAAHDGLPADLDALVPEYIPALPIDPFDPEGGSIRYAVSNDTWRAWSVGEDFKDDGGRIHYKDRAYRGQEVGKDHIFYSDAIARALKEDVEE